MQKKLYIITTCSNSKLVKANRKCTIRNYKKMDWREALENWQREVLNSSPPRIPAGDLYCGSHWAKSVASLKTAKEQHLDVSLMVLSAGWGFIGVDTEIIPYNSTFSSGDSDSIMSLSWPSGMSNKEKCSIWWRSLHDVRNLQALDSPDKFAANIDKAVFLFILSKEYYYALEQDLLEILGLGHDVIIVSAGLYGEINLVSPILRPNILPINDKFKQLPGLNCANVALNSTVTNWLLQNYSGELLSDNRKLYKTIQEIEKGLLSKEQKIPIKMNDEQVLDFIAQNYSAENNNSATRLLRVLRHLEGKSCEQKRFGRLFEDYITSLDKQGSLF